MQCCFVILQVTKHCLLLCYITHKALLNFNQEKFLFYASTMREAHAQAMYMICATEMMLSSAKPEKFVSYMDC